MRLIDPSLTRLRFGVGATAPYLNRQAESVRLADRAEVVNSYEQTLLRSQSTYATTTMSEQSARSVTEIMDATDKLQELICPTNEFWKIAEKEGIHLEVQAAVHRAWRAAEAFRDSGVVSDEEEEENDGWEDGDMSSAEIAAVMVNNVEADPRDFADLVTTMHVEWVRSTRKPKAAGEAIVQLLKENYNDVAMMKMWKKLFISVDGLGRCGYILKQNWLDDYPWDDDADPREAVLRILDLLSYNDPIFCGWMCFRGNDQALKAFIADAPKQPSLTNARMLLERLEYFSQRYDHPKDVVIAAKDKEIQDLKLHLTSEMEE